MEYTKSELRNPNRALLRRVGRKTERENKRRKCIGLSLQNKKNQITKVRRARRAALFDKKTLF